MKKEKLSKWLKYSTNGLLIAYFIMMLTYFLIVPASTHSYEVSDSPYKDQLILYEEGDGPSVTYSTSEYKQIWLNYYAFYLANAILICCIVWFDPDKRAKIALLEKKIIEAGKK